VPFTNAIPLEVSVVRSSVGKNEAIGNGKAEVNVVGSQLDIIKRKVTRGAGFVGTQMPASYSSARLQYRALRTP